MRTRVLFTVMFVLFFAASLALLAQAPAATAQAPAPAKEDVAAQEAPAPTPEVPTGKTRFEGTLANTGGSLYLGGFFTVEIEKWTTPEEGAELKKILAVGGQKALLDKVWKAKQIGFLKVGNSMGKALFFARAIATPGGLVIRALTNSPLGRGSGRAGDYPFGVVEMIIPNGEKGYGTLVGMAQIGFAPNGGVQIEGYGTVPVKLMEIEMKKK